MTEYIVVEDGSPHGLALDVNKAIAAGWQPIGGVCVTHYDGDPRRFIQAMIRDKAGVKAAPRKPDIPPPPPMQGS